MTMTYNNRRDIKCASHGNSPIVHRIDQNGDSYNIGYSIRHAVNDWENCFSPDFGQSKFLVDGIPVETSVKSNPLPCWHCLPPLSGEQFFWTSLDLPHSHLGRSVPLQVDVDLLGCSLGSIVPSQSPTSHKRWPPRTGGSAAPFRQSHGVGQDILDASGPPCGSGRTSSLSSPPQSSCGIART